MHSKAEEAGDISLSSHPHWSPTVAAPVGRGLSGVGLVMSKSLSSACPALVSAFSGACLRITAHPHSTPLSVGVTGMETEAAGEPGV